MYYLLYISVKLSALLCVRGGGERIEKINPTDIAVPTLFKQIQRNYFFYQGIEFVSVSSVKVFFPTCVILKKDSGDVHKFCTTLMEKTVGEIGILISDLFSDQFFLQCTLEKAHRGTRQGRDRGKGNQGDRVRGTSSIFDALQMQGQ